MIYRRIKLVGLLLCALSAVTSFAAPAASAKASRAHSPAILLRPSDAQGGIVYGSGYYRVTAKPGETVSLYAFIGNKGTSRERISLVPVDATSGKYGAVSYNLPQQRRKLVGSWVRLPRTHLSLDANQGAIVPFKLRVPANATAGQYVGALTAFVPQTAHVKHGFGLILQTRVFDAIVVTIAGPTRASLQIHALRAKYRSGDMYVMIYMRNTGNVLLQAHGYIWVYAPHAAKPWIHRTFFVDTTVPRTKVRYPVFWAHHVKPGQYRYLVRLSWGSGSTSSDGVQAQLRWRAGGSSSHGYLKAS